MATVLITGASRGIGLETARALVTAGHSVWTGSRDKARGEAAAAAVGGRFVQLDVLDDESVAAAAGTVGALDVLINNAGVLEPNVPLPDVTTAELMAVFDTNIFGAVRTTNAFLPALTRSAAAAVVNMFTAQYAKACPALRVNCVNPGLTGTDMMNGFGQPPAVAAAAIARIATAGPESPTGRFLGADGVIPW
ncbi:SDR family NAD(P)-dependent oxidoreductase [Lentzea albida]|uniref:NADP-dependent 3-hydroxy acid dehydrogenase YdfG n=1 Tax=Lentzea albida TaxID=65499 RepID=A0A1H9K1L6_9PSEU|nr:SDR family NAD(P)-dependent oxidoreductase [Lentzea albida]SEQ93032.1 NADP-dependent 3-hydroxy acid dehydrogenase YdfG [Lentzea albida]